MIEKSFNFTSLPSNPKELQMIVIPLFALKGAEFGGSDDAGNPENFK